MKVLFEPTQANVNQSALVTVVEYAAPNASDLMTLPKEVAMSRPNCHSAGSYAPFVSSLTVPVQSCWPCYLLLVLLVNLVYLN